MQTKIILKIINFHAPGNKEITLGEEAEKINMYFGEVSTYNKVSGTGYFSDKDIRTERILQPV